MKIALMAGSLKNAGDYLIVQRSEELLKHIYPECEITKYERWLKLDEKINTINQNDAMVFAGGPAYIPNLYPQKFPLVKNLEEIKPKMFALGFGWWENDVNNETMYNFNIEDTSEQFLKRIIKDTKKLGCRDWYSVLALKQNHIYDTIMTGCPAWYNLKTIGNSPNISNEYKKICISDPGCQAYHIQCIPLVTWIKKSFPNSKIYFVFHRGVNGDKNTSQNVAELNLVLSKHMERLDVECTDISYSSEGLKIYDDCDLHIGYRVHAHIYNLSHKNKTILIEEDSRGIGVNQALGLPSIRAFKSSGTKKALNKYIINNLQDYLFTLESNNNIQLRIAYSNIEKYFEKMVEHIKLLGDSI